MTPPVSGGVPEPEKAYQNTDRELWRAPPGDYYADSIHVTEGGGIGMNVGGFVVVMPIRDWHKLAKGGVPEQGLRDAAQRVLKEFEVPSIDGKDRRFDYAACDWCDGEGEETHPETIAHEPSCVIGQLRAALERPRPALPAPEPPVQKIGCPKCGGLSAHWANCGREPLSASELRAYVAKGISYDERPEKQGPLVRELWELLQRMVGAALPAEHAPPDPKLSEIRARLEAATPGPWQVLPPSETCSDRWFVSRIPGCGDVPPEKFYIFSVGLAERDRADANLCAHAPGDIRYLLELVGSRPALAGSRDAQIDAIAKLMQDRYPFRAAFAQIAREMYDAGVRAAVSGSQEQHKP